jgi:solute carrier family 66 (lysosomal lysine-arginine transporter), member 1
MNNKECVVSGEILSNILGVLSSVVWFFVLMPQLYINFKNQTSEAISLSLILLWIVGDIFSMISAQAKGISYTVIYIAWYHIILGGLFAMQIIYYRALNKRYSSETVPLIWETIEDNEPLQILYRNEKIFLATAVSTTICSLFIINQPYIADIIGWISTFIFIGSRIPQIYLNYQRKSTEGLSIYSFILINVANLLFLTSILVNLCDTLDTTTFIIENLQWILGSSTTVLFDLIIFYQFQLYQNF